MKREPRIDARSWVFSNDLFKAMLENLLVDQPVTRCVLRAIDPGQDAIEFEVRVTRIGNTRIPARLPAVEPPTPKRDRR